MSGSDYSFSREGNTLMVTFHTTKFDAQAAQAFNETVRETWNKSVQSVVVDIQNVEFIDSSGVGALLALRKRLPSDAPAICLRGPHANVVGVLEMLRLHRVFRLETR